MTKSRAAGYECFHCRQWILPGQAHDCWTTTETALTKDLSEDLREAYERIRETAAEFGEQRIYASLNSIMFSKKACYFFVRPKKKYLEVCIFLGRPLVSPLVKKAAPSSKVKFYNLLRIQHRDQVEAPITDWMREAFEQSDALTAGGKKVSSPPASATRSPRRARPKASGSTRQARRSAPSRRS